MEEIIVGYQGTELSNNHMAARHFAEQNGWKGSQLRPLVTGKDLLSSLKNREIRYGVYAYSTAAGGIVEENAAVFGNGVRILARYDVDIHHALFMKPGAAREKITAAASHPEALRECRKTLEQLYPGITLQPMKNTGVAAGALAEGDLPDCTAVLCPLALGRQLGLETLLEQAEDLAHNSTTFVLVELKP